MRSGRPRQLIAAAAALLGGIAASAQLAQSFMQGAWHAMTRTGRGYKFEPKFRSGRTGRYAYRGDKVRDREAGVWKHGRAYRLRYENAGTFGPGKKGRKARPKKIRMTREQYNYATQETQRVSFWGRP